MSSRGPSATTTTAPGCWRARRAKARRARRPAARRPRPRAVRRQHRLRRGQRPAREARCLLGQRRDRGQRLLGGGAVAPLAGQGVRVDQRVDHRGQPGRAGVVGRVPRPRDQCLRVGGGVEEAAVVGAEAVERGVEQRRSPGRARRASPVAWTSDEEAGRHAAVVLEHPGRAAPTTPSRETRRSRPSTTCTRQSSSPAATAASTYDGSPRRRPASQRPVMASPFQAATTLSSRAGRTRWARASNSRRRTSSSRARSSRVPGSTSRCRVELPCSKVPASVTDEHPRPPRRRRRGPSTSTSSAGVQA